MSEWVEAAIATVVVFVLLYFAMRGEVEGDDEAVSDVRESGARPSATSHEEEAEEEGETSKPVTVNTRPSPRAMRASEAIDEPAKSPSKSLPKMDFEEDEDIDPTKVGPRRSAVLQLPVMRIVYDGEAAVDEPTQPGALILVTATAQTDKGMRRKRNEDSLLVMPDEGVFVVADGMGGYRGGEIASQIAVRTIENAFRNGPIEGELHEDLPKRASELVRAVQLANEAIMERADQQKELAGMGTTICAARFSSNKQRLYIGHVGDSRMYRARGGVLEQMTSDHTMEASFGVKGDGAAHLSRAVGVWPVVPVDVILGKPIPEDIYLICSDGLTKMLADEEIQKVVTEEASPTETVEKLVARANASGGKDNISVILIRVYRPGVSPPSA